MLGPAVCKLSYMVEACIRRNFKYYPVNMHTNMPMSAAVCFFDVVKNVMSSTEPEKNRPPS